VELPAAAAGVENSELDGNAVAIASICARSAPAVVPSDPPPFTTPAMLAMMPFFVLRRSISPGALRFSLRSAAWRSRPRRQASCARHRSRSAPTPAVHRSSPAVVPGSERRRRRPHRLEARPGHPGDERGAGPRHVECKRGHLRGNLPILVQDQQIARLGRKLLLCGEGAIPVDRPIEHVDHLGAAHGRRRRRRRFGGRGGLRGSRNGGRVSRRARAGRRWTAARAKPGREGSSKGSA